VPSASAPLPPALGKNIVVERACGGGVEVNLQRKKDFVDCNELYIVVIQQNNTMNTNKTKKLAEGEPLFGTFK